MKIAVRGGHVPNFTGANGIINELTEDRKVKDSVINYLRQLGCEVLRKPFFFYFVICFLVEDSPIRRACNHKIKGLTFKSRQ